MSISRPRGISCTTPICSPAVAWFSCLVFSRSWLHLNLVCLQQAEVRRHNVTRAKHHDVTFDRPSLHLRCEVTRSLPVPYRTPGKTVQSNVFLFCHRPALLHRRFRFSTYMLPRVAAASPAREVGVTTDDLRALDDLLACVTVNLAGRGSPRTESECQ